MTVREMHYSFKLAKDRLDTLVNQDFNPAEIDWLLNEAQLLYIKRKYNPTFEATEKITKDLANLVIKFPEQQPIIPSVVDGVYELNLSTLKYDHLYVISAYAKVTEPNCTYKTILKPITHDDYLDALRDPFNKSSKEHILYNYGRSSSNPVTLSMYVYPDPIQTVNEITVEYIKSPSRISLGTYTYIDGVQYPETTSELSPHVHIDIVDLAVIIASTNIENPEYIQLKTAKFSLSN
jgi:hypothetical protein